VVQHAIDVVEDVSFGDGFIVVVRAELVECPVRDVLVAVGAIFLVDVEWEASSGSTSYSLIRNAIGNLDDKR
jgi:hypothetical protein